MEKATFAAGCFWGVEAIFRQLDGVKATCVGYIGGITENPTYEEICSDKTEHAEAVEITYDPARISYQDLLDVFWQQHNPTTLNRQGPDIGAQYRSAIFYHNQAQKEAAQISKALLQQSEIYRNQPIVTEISAAGVFYKAEEYHQQYLEKRGFTNCINVLTK
ncbi:peptide-methionine (S)-S-oxide reductase MsrA [Adhaeribacter sp. BT258]|uniref:Peptide methionine sulfoxide reductase MsrA n=1 Tax=Adhaeribacter terrigena TaxID=2793070 RepID=A0ABS1C572_9BACT|nr:peptide-methionine (S)-S-oxide reductase MsrA [Adhaeribacter terrigena]MBK0404346.1 peptide-methionine (S)-S-oxide reductase MsrA [Adhaeribacter terrigena]